MSTTVIISRDSALRARVAQHAGAATVVWVDDCRALEQALSLRIGRVLVDLNVQWEQDIAACIRRCKDEGGARSVVAFLHERTGDVAIRARLAGADRVIPQIQLEAEIDELLGP